MFHFEQVPFPVRSVAIYLQTAFIKGNGPNLLMLSGSPGIEPVWFSLKSKTSEAAIRGFLKNWEWRLFKELTSSRNLPKLVIQLPPNIYNYRIFTEQLLKLTCYKLTFSP